MSKKFEDLTPEDFKDLKIEFAPGCFDNFEGSQEELDEFVNEIKRLFQTGEAQKCARPVDFEAMPVEEAEKIMKALGVDPDTGEHVANSKRKLQ